jgi:hypothetical protein
MPTIDDQLEARFRRDARPLRPPELAVVDARRRARERRIAAMRLGVALAVVGVTVAVFVIARSAVRGQGAVPATRSFDPTAFGTYVFSEVGLRQAEPGEVKGDVDPAKTFIVEYRAAWSDDGYPGVHECRWSVVDPAGDELGATSADLATERTPDGRTDGMQVTITGDPAEAADGRVACDPRRTDSPVAYDISGEEVVGGFTWRPDSRPGVVVRFQVAWPVHLPDYPSLNACTVRVSRTSGEEVARQEFELGVGPGSVEQRVWPDDFVDPSAADDPEDLDADVTCAPYTGQN